MKKIICASFFCTLLSVLLGGLFFGVAFSDYPFFVRGACCFLLTLVLSTVLLFLLFRHAQPVAPAVPAETGQPEPSPAPDGAGKRGYELFQRIVTYMEEKRPYLDERINLEQFSKSIFSNKVYVSKTINYYSGKNFRQFINWYRIRYALDLMRKDPHLKMEEVSMMSGFHSTVSFNMAFRLFEAKTPTAWHEEYVDSLRKR